MPATRRTKLLEWGWKLHRWTFRLSGGRLGSRLFGIPVLRLTTVGRRSGQPRDVMLHYLKHGESYVVVATNSGEPTHPEWYLNIEQNPEGVGQVGSRPVLIQARVAEGEERDRLWQKVVALDPANAEYQRRTDRQIPVVVLDPM
ncbi:MAG: nitroreductase family deazaflavin-dependent oxidoreductase [Anaerolineales bacterium]